MICKAMLLRHNPEHIGSLNDVLTHFDNKTHIKGLGLECWNSNKQKRCLLRTARRISKAYAHWRTTTNQRNCRDALNKSILRYARIESLHEYRPHWFQKRRYFSFKRFARVNFDRSTHGRER